MGQPIVCCYCGKLYRSRSGINDHEKKCCGEELYNRRNLIRPKLVDFWISLAFVLRVRTLLDHSKERISMQF